jgi:hypothetical protein
VADLGVEPENCVAFGAGPAFAVSAEVKAARGAASDGIAGEGFAVGGGAPGEAAAGDEGPRGGDDERDREDHGDENDAEDRGDEDEPGGDEPEQPNEAPALLDPDGSEMRMIHLEIVGNG